ncbi:MAG: TolC family protein [Bryobacteraceae bacterium]|nr:TolC family protein [Bryobacteraceae bacterium]
MQRRIGTGAGRMRAFVLAVAQFGLAATPAALAQEPAQQGGTPLSLSAAVEQALKNNLQSVVAREQVAQARGEKGITLSALLPNLSGVASQANVTSNFAAMGMPVDKLPGFPAFAGPFNRFDARFELVQSVFNLASIRRYQAGAYGVALAREAQRLSVQQVTTAAAVAYLAVLESEESVKAAQSNVQLAERLRDLAVHQKEAGVAAGIDVARAETRLANQQVQLAQARTNLDTARLELLRIIGGEPLSSQVTLSDRMRVAVDPERDMDGAVRQALADRAEVGVAEQQLRIAGAQSGAAKAAYMPSVSIFGDYGSSGLKPNEMNLPTRSIGVQIDVPIFNGGRTRSEVQVAASRQRETDARLRDVRAAVEKDVRQALLNLKTREEQVHAAETAVSLATRELELAQDRFSNGLADNVEVVNAQTALENARFVMVSSLTQFNIARLNVASALGHVEDFRL